jgi:hypothetical protein
VLGSEVERIALTRTAVCRLPPLFVHVTTTDVTPVLVPTMANCSFPRHLAAAQSPVDRKAPIQQRHALCFVFRIRNAVI